MANYKVYDLKNPERLLGRVELAHNYDRMPTFRLARMVAPRFTLTEPSELAEAVHVSQSLVEFKREWKKTEERKTTTKRVITEEAVLLTDAPLDALVTIKGFELEGAAVIFDRYRKQNFFF